MGIALVTLSIIFGLIISYLIGNILFAQVIAKFYYKKNIRDQGSRNPGATNLVRITKNRYVGVVASFLDAAKGYVCVVIATFTIGLLLKKYNMEELSPFIFLCGTFAILGHCFPIFYCVKLFKGVKGEELKKYSGGKGVSTFGGTVFAVAPYLGLLALGVWILIILITRYVSVSSIIACLLASSLIWIPIFRNNYLIDTTDHSVTLLFIFIILQFGSLLVLVRHIPNIKKLISGTENKAFTKK